MSTASGSPPPLLALDRPAACPEGAAGAACAPETPGQLTAADEFLKATLAHDHLDRRLPRTRPRRRHVRDRRDRHRRRACRQAPRPRRSPPSRPPAWLLISPFARGGHAFACRLRPNFTDAEPRRAPAPMRNHPTTRTETPVARFLPAHRKAACRGWPRSWALPPCCSRRRPSARPKNPTRTTTTASAASPPARPKQAAKNSRCEYTLLLQRPDHRLPAAVPDPG